MDEPYWGLIRQFFVGKRQISWSNHPHFAAQSLICAGWTVEHVEHVEPPKRFQKTWPDVRLGINHSINDSIHDQLWSRSSKLCTTGMLLILDGSWTRCSLRCENLKEAVSGGGLQSLTRIHDIILYYYYIISYYLIWYSCHKILSSTLCGATSWHGAKCHWMKTRKTEIRIVCAVAHDLDSFRFNLYNSSCHYFRMLPNFQGYWYSTKSRVNKHVPFHFHAHITVYRYVQYPTLFLSLFYFFCIRRYG